jgi:hypothetical protein|tara:strand:+ start:79 stop:255 length:177 start_codon:yes stop_codon:yes gene_type:complete
MLLATGHQTNEVSVLINADNQHLISFDLPIQQKPLISDKSHKAHPVEVVFSWLINVRI